MLSCTLFFFLLSESFNLHKVPATRKKSFIFLAIGGAKGASDFHVPLVYFASNNEHLFSAPTERIVLYDQANFRGTNITIHCDAPFLGSFNNRASSARVYG